MKHEKTALIWQFWHVSADAKTADPCATGNGGCDQTCESDPFKCVCTSPWELHADGKSCTSKYAFVKNLHRIYKIETFVNNIE